MAGLDTWLRQQLDEHRVELPCHRWSGDPFLRVSCTAHTSDADVDSLLLALRQLL